MPRMECRNCGYTRTMTQREADFGMDCPECYGRRLKPVPRKRSRVDYDVSVRPVTMQALIGGALALAVGIPLVLYGRENWNAGRFGARFIGVGLTLIIGGIIGLVIGVTGLIRDSR